jgi:hypothetical protein
LARDEGHVCVSLLKRVEESEEGVVWPDPDGSVRAERGDRGGWGEGGGEGGRGWGEGGGGKGGWGERGGRGRKESEVKKAHSGGRRSGRTLLDARCPALATLPSICPLS